MTRADNRGSTQRGQLLPEGWRWVRLSEGIREAQVGFPTGERDAHGVIQLRMNNVSRRGGFDWSSVVRVPTDQGTAAVYQLQPGDVLFNNTNSTELVGKTAFFEGYGEPVVFSNHFTRVRTRADLLSPAFLAIWLQLRWHQRLFANICNRWIGQSAVQRDKLLALEMPLPPLPEQARIVATLTEQMAAGERARAAAQARLEAAKALPAAYLRAVFSSPEVQGWARRRLSDVCRLLPSKSIATDGDTEVRAITTAALAETGFQASGVKAARMWAADALECVVSPGELLVARSNTPELVGRAAMFSGDPPGAVASDLTIRIAPGDEVDPSFATAFLSFLYVTGHWRERAGDASGSMKKITRTQIEDLELPVPSTSEQGHVAEMLEEQMATAERACKAIGAELAAIDALPGAILRRAFSGEL